MFKPVPTCNAKGGIYMYVVDSMCFYHFVSLVFFTTEGPLLILFSNLSDGLSTI